MHRKAKIYGYCKITIKNCDKVEKFKKFKTILVKSLKMKRRFDVRLTSFIKSKMSKMRTNINVKEFLGDTNKKVKICSDNDKIFARNHVKSLARIESF